MVHSEAKTTFQTLKKWSSGLPSTRDEVWPRSGLVSPSGFGCSPGLSWATFLLRSFPAQDWKCFWQHTVPYWTSFHNLSWWPGWEWVKRQYQLSEKLQRRLELSHTANGSIRWFNRFGKLFSGFYWSQSYNLHLPTHPKCKSNQPKEANKNVHSNKICYNHQLEITQIHQQQNG